MKTMKNPASDNPIVLVSFYSISCWWGARVLSPRVLPVRPTDLGLIRDTFLFLPLIYFNNQNPLFSFLLKITTETRRPYQIQTHVTRHEQKTVNPSEASNNVEVRLYPNVLPKDQYNARKMNKKKLREKIAVSNVLKNKSQLSLLFVSETSLKE